MDSSHDVVVVYSVKTWYFCTVADKDQATLIIISLALVNVSFSEILAIILHNCRNLGFKKHFHFGHRALRVLHSKGHKPVHQQSIIL